MAEDEGRIPKALGERNTYYRIVIKYIHDNIIRLVVIDGADETWLSAQLLLWVPAYDDANNSNITNEDLVAEREAIDIRIHDKLDIILNNLTPWNGLTPTDRNTFRLHERATSYVHGTVPKRAPVATIISQAHASANVKAIDPENPKATKLPDGVFLVIWTGYIITNPPVANPVPVFLGWSASIDAKLKLPVLWLKKDCMIEAYYVDKHHGESDVSAPIPITPI